MIKKRTRPNTNNKSNKQSNDFPNNIIYKLIEIKNIVIDKSTIIIRIILNYVIPDNINQNEKAMKKLKRILIIFGSFLLIQAIFITSIIFVTVKSGGRTVKLIDVQGKEMYESITLLQNDGFNLNIEVQYFPEYDSKIVVVQNPAAGTILRKGRTINLIINDTINIGTMPSVIGLNYENAIEKINSNITSGNGQLKILEPIYYSDNTKENGIILSQNPLENVKLSNGSAIQLTINNFEEDKTQSTTTSPKGSHRFAYAVPFSIAGQSLMSISLEDETGVRVLYTKNIQPGERISFSYNLIGIGTITVYYDEIPYETMRVE